MKKFFCFAAIILTLAFSIPNSHAAYPTTTEHYKLYPYTSVMASPYSCDPTGVLDCTASIELIKTNQSNIGRIFVPKGVFLINTDLTIPAGMTLDFAAGGKLSIGAGKTLTVLGQIRDDGQEIFTGSGTVVLSGVESVKLSWFSTLTNADTVAYASSKELIIDEDVDVSANVTVSANTKVLSGNTFAVATTKTLTINGAFEAGLYQVFSCTGTGAVTFGDNSVKEVYPQWWGAVGDDSTICTAAIQAAVNSYRIVHFTKGTYLIDDSSTDPRGIDLPLYTTIKGDGDESIIKQGTVDKGVFFANDYCTFKNLFIRGVYAVPAGATNGFGIACAGDRSRGAYVTVDNCRLEDFSQNAISGPNVNSVITNNRIKNCGNEGIITIGSYCRIEGNRIENTLSWGVDISDSYVEVCDNQLVNCGSHTCYVADDYGGIYISTFNNVGSAAGVGHKIVRNTITTSDGPGIAGSDSSVNYGLSDVIIANNQIRDVGNSISAGKGNGISIFGSTTGLTKNIKYIGNQVYDAKDYGLYSKAASNLSVLNNLVDGVVTYDGIYVTDNNAVSYNISNVKIDGNTILNFKRYGINAVKQTSAYTNIGINNNTLSGYAGTVDLESIIYLYGPDNFTINGNIVTGNVTYNRGILVRSSGYGTVCGNQVNTCKVGIAYIGATDYVSFIGNNLANSNTTAFSPSGTLTNCRVRDNLGYVSENSGTSAAIASGATIAHGCTGTPVFVSVTPAEAGPTDVTTTVNATNITVTFGGGGSKTFFWRASLGYSK